MTDETRVWRPLTHDALNAWVAGKIVEHIDTDGQGDDTTVLAFTDGTALRVRMEWGEPFSVAMVEDAFLVFEVAEP